jgi:membrane fusion protein (multidrug efflux system)
MGVKVSFLSGEDMAPTSRVRALVPGQAIREQGKQQVVFLYQDGRLVMRGVTPGEKRAGEVEILEGVSPGDQVVVSDLSRLRDGQRATLKE